MAKSAVSLNPTREDFESLLAESYSDNPAIEGTVVKGKVVNIENDFAIIDVGLKTEGKIAVKEFAQPGKATEIKPGDTVEVYLERIENAMGEAVLSRDKARREEAWTRLEQMANKNERVDGVIFGRVKGGFTVDLGGAVAFLPGSQVDVRPIRDVGPLMNVTQPFQILKMDRRRGNIVVSRRAIMEETRAEQRSELVQNLAEGQVVEGVVKNITDYGAFVDLGGIDGLLHVTDIAWKRVNHPSDVLHVGQTVKVQIIRINPETQRISLGMKQLDKDPWEVVTERYPIGAKVKGKVTNITEFGLFIGLDGDVDGMVHLSDIDWKRSGEEAIKDYKKGDHVRAKVLDVDREKERISLGIKQLGSDPMASAAGLRKGDTVTCEVLKVEDNGLEVKVAGTDMTAYIKRADLARDRAEQRPEGFAVVEKFDAKITVFDAKARKMNVSIKALEIADEKEAVAQYGSSDSGASLGDILGAALKRKDAEDKE